MAMTDEERAREIASYLGHSHEVRARFMKMVTSHFSAIRADERENCAQVVEAELVDQICASELGQSYNRAVRDAAAAIRAMGDK